MNNIDILKDLIINYSNIHMDFAQNFFEAHKENLTEIKRFDKLDVKKVINNENSINDIILDYRTNLEMYDKLAIFIAKWNQISYNDVDELAHRIKLNDTINRKLQHYAKKEEIQGTLYLAKCLNDVCGIRFISSQINSQKNLLQAMLTDLKQDHIVKYFYFKNKDGYRGIHVYFQYNNRTLPWELQIWDKSDEARNISLHKQHEREEI